MKKKVAIFPAGSEIGLEINNALKYSTYYEVWGLSSVPCHAEYVYSNYIDGLPFYTNDNFIKKLNEVLENKKIDFVYPAYDDVQLFLTRNQERIHAKIVTSELITVEICRSKIKTYKYFEGEWFIPKYYEKVDDVTCYPVFLKPDVGQGSQGAKKINSIQELEYSCLENPNVVICEFLPGEEFTVDCFTNKDRELLVCKYRNRKRIRNGISVSSEELNVPDEVVKIAEKINEKLKFIGAWFFQIKKRDSGEYILLEIAPRIAGTMGISRNTGINYPLLTLFTLQDIPIDIINNKYNICVDRALISRYKTDIKYDYVYVDLDDTMIVNKKVNTSLMAFLYQIVNEKKKIVLLTKHIGNVNETLSKYHISENLFDEIINIEKDEEKSDFIRREKAIFIDDSFSERRKVSINCNIPVFDCSEVEALLDWRI